MPVSHTDRPIFLSFLLQTNGSLSTLHVLYYHYQLIIAEILSYNADIISLQEVDAATHNSLLRPVLEANGYQGFYSNKVSYDVR